MNTHILNYKYSGKILSYFIIFYLIFVFLVGLNKTQSLLVSFIIIISISIIESIIYLNDNILTDCSSCKLPDKKNTEKFENIASSPNNMTNTGIMTDIVNNNILTNPSKITITGIPSTDNNTNNTNDTNKNFNNFIDNQSKENEKIITNFITNNKDTDYMNNYVQYQKNGMELSDTEQALKENIWRASIGNQDVVQPFLKDAKNYYNNIFKRGVNNSPPDEMLKNYLESAEYNYIVPRNEGMVNPEYTFVSPSNWNFLPFSPPVCVIDKKRKTTVVPTITRSDQMPFASMEEFDRAARFTGNMQINTEFIQNYLNNPMV
jgi:hypothetical protein